MFLAGTLIAQPSLAGGGGLTLAGKAYRFQPTGLSVARPKGGLPGAIRLAGSLVPTSGDSPFRLSMTFLRSGQLYLMEIRRGGKGQYPDTWAATPGTHLKIPSLQTRPGGRIEVVCTGTLTGVIGQKPAEGRWNGRIWVVVPQTANLPE
jgi:hypothetical protein